MTEGSVEVDTGSLPLAGSEEVSEETTTTSEESDQTEDQGETQDQAEDQGEEQKLTEKGTKLDPNPLSAAHQKLANAEATVKQYQKVLGDPDLLKRYASQMGLTLAEAKQEIKEEQKNVFKPEQFTDAKALAETLNQMQSRFETEVEALRKENGQLKQGFSGFSETQKIERVATNMARDLEQVREKYPELNPKSPEYNRELEEEIGSFFLEVDGVNPEDASQGFQGKHSLAKIAERFMRVGSKAKQQGSQRAQTDVKVKQAGKVVTSSKGGNNQVSESKDPATTIAQRIAKTFGNG